MGSCTADEAREIGDVHSNVVSKHLSSVTTIQNREHKQRRQEKETGTFKQAMDSDELDQIDASIAKLTDYNAGSKKTKDWEKVMMHGQFFDTSSKVSIAIGTRGVNMLTADFSDFFYKDFTFDKGMGFSSHFEVCGVELTETKRKTRNSIRRGLIPHFKAARCPILSLFKWLIARFFIRQDSAVPGERDQKDWIRSKMFPGSTGDDTSPLDAPLVYKIYKMVLKAAGVKKAGQATRFTRRVAEQFNVENGVEQNSIDTMMQHATHVSAKYKSELDQDVLVSSAGWGKGFAEGILLPSLAARDDLISSTTYLGLLGHLFTRITGDSVEDHIAAPENVEAGKEGNTAAQTKHFVATVLVVGLCRLREMNQPDNFVFTHELSPLSKSNTGGKWRKLFDDWQLETQRAVDDANTRREARIAQMYAGRGYDVGVSSSGGGSAPGGGIEAQMNQVLANQTTIQNDIRSISPDTAAATAAASSAAVAAASAAAAESAATASASAASATATAVAAKPSVIVRKRKNSEGGDTERYKKTAFSIDGQTLAKCRSCSKWYTWWSDQPRHDSTGMSMSMRDWEHTKHGGGKWRQGAAEKVRKQMSRHHELADFLAYSADLNSTSEEQAAQLLDTAYAMVKVNAGTTNPPSKCPSLTQYVAKRIQAVSKEDEYVGFVKGRAAFRPNEQVKKKLKGK